MSLPDTGWAEALLAEFSTYVLDKAGRARRDGLVVPDSHYERVWWVGSLRPEQTTPHRVTLTETPDVRWISCSCKHGTTAGGGSSRCYHVAAALTYVLDRRTP